MTPDDYEVTDCTGVLKGNADLADSCQRVVPGEPERPPQLVDAPMAEAFKDYDPMALSAAAGAVWRRP